MVTRAEATKELVLCLFIVWVCTVAGVLAVLNCSGETTDPAPVPSSTMPAPKPTASAPAADAGVP